MTYPNEPTLPMDPNAPGMTSPGLDAALSIDIPDDNIIKGTKYKEDKPAPTLERLELVKSWLKKIEEAEEFWKPTFDEMRGSAKFAAGKQWPMQSKDDDRYIANITLRHINQRVASIYAKNPKVQVQRKEKIWLTQWDGTQEQLKEAQATLAWPQIQQQAAAATAAALVAGQPPAPPPPPPTMDPILAQTIVQEEAAIRAERGNLDKQARSLELVAQYSLDEIIPRFKLQAKQLVRRVQTCKAGFLKLGYQRKMGRSPNVEARIRDASDRILYLQSLAEDLAEHEIETHSKEVEELKLNLNALMQQPQIVQREGLVFGFPKSWSLIIDPNCIQLKGFVGADWIAEKYIFTPRQIEMYYGIDVKQGYDAYKLDGEKSGKRTKGGHYCAVYEVYDLFGQTCFTVIGGYKDFVKEPAEPDVFLEQFHPYFSLTFNDIESDETIFPPSDVELMRPMAVEYNRAREGLRIHRIANRPAWITAKGVFEEEDKNKLASHADQEIIETNLSKNDVVEKLIQPKPTAKVDPTLYDTEAVFVDSQRVVGSQAEDMGGSSATSATSASIAEGSRVSSIQSCIDDLDEFLTDVMRAAGQILIREMSGETAKEIAGPGAMWPEMDREAIVRELSLNIKAGSSGKPNKAGRIAAVEKLAPFLLQMPGIDPLKLGGFLLRELDENIDVEDFQTSNSSPSVVAMNAQSKPNQAPMAGGPAQAPMGAENSEKPKQSPAKMQNTMPSGYDQQAAVNG